MQVYTVLSQLAMFSTSGASIILSKLSWKHLSFTMSFLGDVKAPGTNQDQKQSEKAIVVPTSLASLILGAVGGEQSSWYVQYSETKIFRDTCQKIKDRTGVDFSGIIAASVALHSAKNYIPDLAKGVLQHIKAQATSSITLGPNDSALQDALLRFIRDINSDADKTWRGKHEQRDKDGKLQYLTGETKPTFWFDKTWFMLDEPSAETRSAILNAATTTHTPQIDPLTILCLGHSNKPISMLLEHIQMEQLKSEQLQVYKVITGTERTEDKRDKRWMSSIDIEPRIAAQVLQEVGDLFYDDTPKLYRDTSRPHRMGFLLHGPPGTGKTSLSFAIASHVSRALVIINLQGMEDADLEAAFANLPLPCVVLIEDIDACSADVGARSKPLQKRLEVSEESEEQVDKVEVAAAQQKLEASNDEFVRQKQDQMSYGNFEEDKNYDTWSPYSQKNPAASPQEGFKRPVKQPPASNLNKSVSLQGLLNVIDGPAAVENRLL
ncbi:hypothetical protein BDU57DRAFT_139489 [Ampelomyces quisqualis]|uniref:P-loop containing nucleoside triphosphate hydrolase protein n=1 Tax=Ampelomyces quisqualis TaxID=50730 RepID=A0A6A5QVC7_AMPQU|nr:hypothetical protein BDU57DRAFT_139489 [Ampelomyces quisqualis]